ncbi:FK506-binding nuclear protein, putative [Eimeria tenella]|uniref:peptidylprolyl isomerase n=1 Tax=Eimeria tenella TaxID=5802 RepID=U6KK38_EIMTE|nr:FK506-binding nuclear protein, putative [Eimeria tenella]CDJ37181.1 FK506-binding nuclear protein, putative [Eimeria tenella]|eukprot:XP_013228019.1 FK506-binding nuclear protein, putative [Eimeria tenella]
MAFWGGLLTLNGDRLHYRSHEGILHLAAAVPVCPIYLQQLQQQKQKKQQQQQQQQQQQREAPSWVLMMRTAKVVRAPIARIGEFRQPIRIVISEDTEFWLEAAAKASSKTGWAVQLAGALVPRPADDCSCCSNDCSSSSIKRKRRVEADADEVPKLVDEQLYRQQKLLKQQQQQQQPQQQQKRSLQLELAPETKRTPSLVEQLSGQKAHKPQQRPPPLSQQQQQQQQQKQQQQQGSDEVRAGDVYRLPSGVEFTVLRTGAPGGPPRCERGCNVTIQYKGLLLKNRHCFDKGKITFCVGAHEVIKGLELGLLGCRVGETRRISIPSALGYGKRGAPPSIPPNADLLFECTCTRIKR